MSKEQEFEVAGEVGGVVIKVVIAGAGLWAAGPAGALATTWAATLASELVGIVIPNLRRNRVEKFIQELCARVSHLEEEQIRTRFLQQEFIDLFEDGCVQASRALDAERIEQLATFLETSLTDEQLKYAHDKRLLSLLGELNRVELILLRSYAEQNKRNQEFRDKYSEIFRYDTPIDASYEVSKQFNEFWANASYEVRKQHEIITSYRSRLFALQLVVQRISPLDPRLTVLGAGLLKKIGAEDEDAQV